jgi:hypothetical protein
LPESSARVSMRDRIAELWNTTALATNRAHWLLIWISR